MLKLKQLDPHSWEFAYPDGYNDILDMVDKGCDFYEMGDFVEAEKVFEAVVDKMPDCLDGLHHWALIREKSGDIPKAKEIIKKRHKKPKSLRDGFITVGGDDEAYEYWERNGVYWESSVSAINWVKAALQRNNFI